MEYIAPQHQHRVRKRALLLPGIDVTVLFYAPGVDVTVLELGAIYTPRSKQLYQFPLTHRLSTPKVTKLGYPQSKSAPNEVTKRVPYTQVYIYKIHPGSRNKPYIMTFEDLVMNNPQGHKLFHP